jgi:hypothetical protein
MQVSPHLLPPLPAQCVGLLFTVYSPSLAGTQQNACVASDPNQMQLSHVASLPTHGHPIPFPSLPFPAADGSEAEAAAHKSTFLTNLAEIHQHNSNGLKAWVAGVNQFTDLTAAEMQQFKGLQRSSSAAAAHSIVYPALPAGETLPDSIDWRAKGVVTDVKNQGEHPHAHARAHLDPLHAL